MNKELILQILYLAACVLFILGLKALSSPKSARRGMNLAALGMLLAVVGTLFHREIITYEWIIAGFIIGSLVGGAMAIFMPMTAMPQRIALSHAFGALAAVLVGIVELHRELSHVAATGGAIPHGLMGAVGFEVLFGSLTVTGSFMAFGKLQELITGTPITYRFQNMSNIALFVVTFLIFVFLTVLPDTAATVPLFYLMIVAGLAIGVLLVLPIGGADMPVVISLLNSYAGLAAAATGFVIHNNVLIVAGALDGASGFFLSILMSRAMNRSFANVLFGAVGAVKAETAAAVEGRTVIRYTPEDAVSTHGGRGVDHHHPRIRDGGRPGAAHRAGVVRVADRAGYQGPVRDPSRGRPHAGAHERAAGRSRRALRAAARNGPHQQRLPEHGRGAGGGRQRRRQSGGPLQERQPAVRHADPGRRQGPHGDHPETESEARLCGRRQRVVLRSEDDDGLR